MNKITQFLRLFCAIAWLAVLAIVLLKPGIDCTVLFIIAVATLILQNIAEYIMGRENNARQIERPND